MYDYVTVVGERGQITIPKSIRDKEGLKPKDKIIVKIEEERIVLEKQMTKREKHALMEEGYKKMARLDKEIAVEMRHVSKEADAMLDDY